RGARLTLDVTHHPGRAGDRGERPAGEGLVPWVRELGQPRGDPGLGRLGGIAPGVVDPVTVLDIRFAVGVVVGLLALVDSGGEDARGAVHERVARLRLVLLAEADEVLPGRPLLGQLGWIAGHPGLVEEVGAVADRLRADVRAET